MQLIDFYCCGATARTETILEIKKYLSHLAAAIGCGLTDRHDNWVIFRRIHSPSPLPPRKDFVFNALVTWYMIIMYRRPCSIIHDVYPKKRDTKKEKI